MAKKSSSKDMMMAKKEMDNMMKLKDMMTKKEMPKKSGHKDSHHKK